MIGQSAISQENVNIIAISQGSSELTISIVVAKDGLEKAVQAIHRECGLSQSARRIQPHGVGAA